MGQRTSALPYPDLFADVLDLDVSTVGEFLANYEVAFHVLHLQCGWMPSCRRALADVLSNITVSRVVVGKCRPRCCDF